MPRIILIVVTLLLCPALVSLADKRRVGSGQEAEVQEFLDRQIEAFEKRDLSALMTMLAPEASVVMLGNGPNERWVGPESIKKVYQDQLAQYESEEFTLHGTSIGAKDTVAWFSTQARVLKITATKDQSTLLINWSGVLQKRDGKWLLIQSHFSLPISKQ